MVLGSFTVCLHVFRADVWLDVILGDKNYKSTLKNKPVADDLFATGLCFIKIVIRIIYVTVKNYLKGSFKFGKL